MCGRILKNMEIREQLRQLIEQAGQEAVRSVIFLKEITVPYRSWKYRPEKNSGIFIQCGHAVG